MRKHSTERTNECACAHAYIRLTSLVPNIFPTIIWVGSSLSIFHVIFDCNEMLLITAETNYTAHQVNERERKRERKMEQVDRKKGKIHTSNRASEPIEVYLHTVIMAAFFFQLHFQCVCTTYTHRHRHIHNTSYVQQPITKRNLLLYTVLCCPINSFAERCFILAFCECVVVLAVAKTLTAKNYTYTLAERSHSTILYNENEIFYYFEWLWDFMYNNNSVNSWTLFIYTYLAICTLYNVSFIQQFNTCTICLQICWQFLRNTSTASIQFYSIR